MGGGRPACAGDTIRDRLRRLQVAIDRRNGGAAQRKEARNGRSDARACPGHHGGLPLEIEHYRRPEHSILYR